MIKMTFHGQQRGSAEENKVWAGSGGGGRIQSIYVIAM